MDSRTTRSKWLSNWPRAGGISGIAYVVLFVIGVVSQGDVPMYGSSGEEISRFFADNSSQYMTMTVIPAWKLRELLDGEEFVAKRKEQGTQSPQTQLRYRIGYCGRNDRFAIHACRHGRGVA